MSQSKVFSKDILYNDGKTKRVFSQDATEAAFLLGGIGTGNFSIGARGEMRDWEIFNHAGKGASLPYTFFSIWCKEQEKKSVTRVIESQLNSPFSHACGVPTWKFGGLPRLDSSTLTANYPFVDVEFSDKELPVLVSLEGFTPFIPLNPDDSGIPAAIMRYRVKNPCDVPVDVSVCLSMSNAVGYRTQNAADFMTHDVNISKNVASKYIEDGDVRGLLYTSLEKESPFFCDNSIAITTTAKDITVKPSWLEGGWSDGIQDFWNDFSEDGKLDAETRFKLPESKISPSIPKVGSLASYQTILPGEEKIFEFCISWYIPLRNKEWNESKLVCCETCDEYAAKTIRNYYATKFKDAFDAASYLHTNLPRLEKHSRDFSEALYASTLPDYVLDAISANITVFRSPTCFRLENGTFCGWEGCFDQSGCCSGSCTHVWNYAQTLAFLFPSLERSMRMVEFGLETDDDGNMAFRSERVFGNERWDFAAPATDGQMGSIIRLYREWKLSGDDEFLKSLWGNAKKALDFAFSYWDSDEDNVLDSEQHNTYDIEFYGPSSLTNSMFYAALLAMEKMAEYLLDTDYAQKCRNAFETGSKKMDELLWNGEYYIQRIDDVDKYKYQYGTGCLSDQLIGQFLAHVTGLGHVLPEEHVKKAILSVFQYNFLEDFSAHVNTQRTYVLNNEKGLLLCSWPKGGRPYLPMVYADEVWTGIEYQVASHLIFEGFIDEGLTIVKALRDRQNGYKRNPWDEVECGHHYARSMASWGLLTALSGFDCDMTGDVGMVSFAPRINQRNFTIFWSTGKAWGTYKQIEQPNGEFATKLTVLYGEDTGLIKHPTATMGV